MRRAIGALVLTLGLVGCGDDSGSVDAPRWRHVRVEGLSNASGLTLYDGDLIAVAGGNDRDIYVVPVDALHEGTAIRARTLAVDVRQATALAGTGPFALQGYTLGHLWSVPLDFQGVAAQAPQYLYLADRLRRVIFWGRLYRAPDGRLERVKLERVSVAPGADRSGMAEGDWGDRGPGLRGLVAVQTPRVEDLYLVEAGVVGEPLAVRRMDRYGSNLGGVRVEHAAADARAVSWDRDRLVLLLGGGRGRIVDLVLPSTERLALVPAGESVPGPDIEGVDGWAGMAHGPDGTLYLVSDGSPCVLAWR